MLTWRVGGQKWQSKWLVKDEVLEEKGEKSGAEGKMAEAEKLKEREQLQISSSSKDSYGEMKKIT